MKMNARKQVESLLPGDIVWIVDVTRGSKWEPVYEGPYSILRQHKSGTYSLLDVMGEILPRRVPISQIKILEAGIDTTASEGGGNEEKHFVVKRIIEHRMRDGMYDFSWSKRTVDQSLILGNLWKHLID